MSRASYRSWDRLQIDLRRGAYRLRHIPFLGIWRAIERLELRDAPQAEYDKFAIYCEPEVAEFVPAIFESVIDALMLIEEVDPNRFARIRNEMPRIFIRRGGGSEYRGLTETCVLEFNHARADSKGNIALTLVHEAAHARIYKAGIRYWPDLVERIEVRCVKEQIAFARRLGVVGWDVGATLRYLETRLSSESRTPETRHHWRLRALRARNAPSWVVRLFEVTGSAKKP